MTIRETSGRRVLAVRGGSIEERDDRLAGEAPLEIRAAGPGQALVIGGGTGWVLGELLRRNPAVRKI